MDNNQYDSTVEVTSVKDRFAGHSVQRRVDGRRIPVMVAGVFCAVLAVVCLSGFTYILFLHPSGDYMSSRYYAQAATKDISDNRADVTLPLYVPDLDVRGSRVPVRIDGTLEDGTAFGQDTFVSNDGKGLRLAPGSYEAYVMGSPISASGVMYIYPSEHIRVVVSSDLNVSYDPVTFMTFGVLGALDVSDEQIEEARAFIVNDPDRMQYADTLAAAVRERREEAIKEIEAQNAARQEAAKVVAEQRDMAQSDPTRKSDSDNNSNNSSSSNNQKQENNSSSSDTGDPGTTADPGTTDPYADPSSGTQDPDPTADPGTGESSDPSPSTEPSSDVVDGGGSTEDVGGGGADIPAPAPEPSAPAVEPSAPAAPVSVDTSADTGGATAAASGMAG